MEPYVDRAEWPRYYRNLRAGLGHGLGIAVGAIPVGLAPYLFPAAREEVIQMAGYVGLFMIGFVLASRLGIAFHDRIGRRYGERCSQGKR